MPHYSAAAGAALPRARRALLPLFPLLARADGSTDDTAMSDDSTVADDICGGSTVADDTRVAPTATAGGAFLLQCLGSRRPPIARAAAAPDCSNACLAARTLTIIFWIVVSGACTLTGQIPQLVKHAGHEVLRALTAAGN